MAFSFVLIAASARILLPCPEYREAVARAQYEAFLDPSASRRAEVRSQLQERLGSTAGACNANEDPGVRKQAAFVDAGDRFSRQAIDQARNRCMPTGGKKTQCSDDDAALLLASGDKAALKLATAIIDASPSSTPERAWLALAVRAPRGERLQRALTSRSGSLEVDRYLQTQALEEAFSTDPRDWSPDEVVTAVRTIGDLVDSSARQRSADFKLNTIPSHPSEEMTRVDYALRYLCRMGAARVQELLPGVRVGSRAHFPLETIFYQYEWEKSPKTESLDAYIERRWAETDQKAPHPNLDAVRDGLKSLKR